jgi:isoquinoline 1-oxidoreductase alpha subunit
MISLSLNGKTVQLSATPDTPLLWALRDELGYTGTSRLRHCACGVHGARRRQAGTGLRDQDRGR